MKTFNLLKLLSDQKVTNSIILMMVLLLSFSNRVYCLVEKLSFEELVCQADLIFIGTAISDSCYMNENGTLILTDVRFDEIEIVSSNDKSISKNLTYVKLTHAGGTLNGMTLSVSDMPVFIIGKRYLLVTHDDGENYINPLIGGTLGQFEVVKDKNGTTEYIINNSGRLVLAFENSQPIFSNKRLKSLNNGLIVYESAENGRDGLINTPPLSEDGQDKASKNDFDVDSEYKNPVSKAEMIKIIQSIKKETSDCLMKHKKDGGYFYYKTIDGEIGSVKIPDADPSYLTLSAGLNIPKKDFGAFRSGMGGQLGYCGYQDLFIVMQQVPTSWWDWAIYNCGMYDWNQVMDVYRYVGWDGSYGPNNGQSEFYSFWSDNTLYEFFERHWGSSVGICFTWSAGGCGEIYESDIVFNQGKSWTDDPNYAINNGNVILLTSVLMHELGHSWGAQRGTSYPETYDYDLPTVMHSYCPNIYETGRGIHWADAYMIRRNYDNQTTILSSSDIGVESYYAMNGLNISTTDKSSYKLGDHLTINNLTVENVGYSSVNELRVRLYLSYDREISTSDYQLPGYYYWGTFSAESYYVGNFTRQIPYNIPMGTYYVGIVVTINGFSTDDFTSNNTTCLTYPVSISGYNDISETELIPQFNAYPNPVQDILTIECSSETTGFDYEVSIYDLTGKVVSTTPYSKGKVQIEISRIASGMYFVKVGNDTTFSTKKIIKK